MGMPALRQASAPPSSIRAIVLLDKTLIGMPTRANANRGVPPIA